MLNAALDTNIPSILTKEINDGICLSMIFTFSLWSLKYLQVTISIIKHISWYEHNIAVFFCRYNSIVIYSMKVPLPDLCNCNFSTHVQNLICCILCCHTIIYFSVTICIWFMSIKFIHWIWFIHNDGSHVNKSLINILSFICFTGSLRCDIALTNPFLQNKSANFPRLL